ncbi:MAG TPA: 16S rRNA (guanine(966)-N(2))-methyltransferase RsmD [Candidatus Limnocylindria bacterium]|nr:16S rRNA (guanine(966)-N(2))-methyltransferase RsmD [Candidatus Limnocylindria bacterium]
MRVIAGTAKGRPLVVPRGGGTRSATDRIRETLFAILEPSLPGARVLDLFAGAGTLGIEALSRGAAHATFVERSSQALAALRQNLKTTGFEGRSDIVPANVLVSLEQRLASPYDLVFCDPPFADVAILESVLALLPAAGALAPDGLAVARVLKKHQPTLPEGARLARTKELGEEALLFLRYDDPGGGG